jgi:transcriptional regulator with XRE-family HTH domain
MTLQEWLLDRNVSQSELARAIGVAPSTVTKYVQGTRIPRREVLIKICEHTDDAVGPADFYLKTIPLSVGARARRRGNSMRRQRFAAGA